MKLSNKLVISLFTISLVSISLIGGVGYYLIRNEAEKRGYDLLCNAADLQLHKIDMLLQNYRQFLTNPATMVNLRISYNDYLASSTPENLVKLRDILTFQKSTGALASVSVVSLNGTTLASSDTQTEGTTYSKLGLAEAAKNGKQIKILTNSNNEPSLFFTEDITVQGKLAGYLIVETDTRELNAIAEDHHDLGQTGETTIVQLVGANWVYVTPLRWDGRIGLTRTMTDENIFPADGIKTEYYTDKGLDYRNHPVLALSRPVDGLNWILTAKIDRSEAFADTNLLQRILFMVYGASLVLVILLALYLANYMTGPLTMLTKFSQRIAEGNFSERVKISTKDEIGVLAKSLNSMAEQLLNVYETLEQKVGERTAELEKKTAELEMNKKELVKKNKDLTRYNEMMIDRELKMIELKKEIAVLRERIEEVQSDKM